MPLRVVLLADTHNQHRGLVLPAGDLLIHAGDATVVGSLAEIADFGEWLGAQPHPEKIFVAGGHDRAFASDPARARALLPREVHYLDEAEVSVGGLRIWGSPWQPEYRGWAFNLPRGAALAERWARIPTGIDVLVTHSPPAGIGDRTVDGELAGCPDLRARVLEVAPRLHVFGHIHEARGSWSIGQTQFVNASAAGQGGAILLTLP